MRRAAALPLALAALAAGCAKDPCAGQSGACLSIHLAGNAPPIAQLDLRVSGSFPDVQGTTGPVSPRISLPVQLPLLLPDGVSGPLLVSVNGLDETGLLATGSASVNLPPRAHARVDVSMTTATAGSDLGTSGDLAGSDAGPVVNVAFSPIVADFGKLDPAALQTVDVNVINTGADPLVFSSIAAPAPFSVDASSVCAVGMTLPSQQSCKLTLSFTSVTPGQFDAAATLTFDAGTAMLPAKARVRGWVQEMPSGATSSLTLDALGGTSANDVWAAGVNGAFLHRNAAGWKSVANAPWPPTATVTSVSALDAMHVFFVANTAVYFTADGGVSWGSATPANITWSSVDAFDANTIYLGSFTGAIYAGNPTAGWQDTTSGCAGSIGRVFHTAVSEYALCAGNSVLVRSTSWMSLFTLTNGYIWKSAWASSDNDFWAVGNLSGACSANCAAAVQRVGTTVRAPVPFPNNVLNAVWSADTSHVWAVGDQGTAVQAVDGTNLMPQNVPTSTTLTAVWGAGEDLFAVGNGGVILHEFN